MTYVITNPMTPYQKNEILYTELGCILKRKSQSQKVCTKTVDGMEDKL